MAFHSVCTRPHFVQRKTNRSPDVRGAQHWTGQQAPRLGQDHPRKAPPVTHPAAVDVIFEVIAMAGGKIECALLGEAIEPNVIRRRQVVIGKVV
jgi:hypothetical protein